MLDFSAVKPAEATERVNYLNPGMYNLKLSQVEKFETSTDTVGMELFFKCKSEDPEYNDGICKGRFFITTKALPRLQYLHNEIFGKPIEKTFSTEDELISYFKSLLPVAPYKKMIAGGKIYNNKVYSDFTYLGFFINEDNERDYEEGPFVVNSKAFQDVMTSDIKTISEDGNESSLEGSMFEDSPFQ